MCCWVQKTNKYGNTAQSSNSYRVFNECQKCFSWGFWRLYSCKWFRTLFEYHWGMQEVQIDKRNRLSWYKIWMQERVNVMASIVSEKNDKDKTQLKKLKHLYGCTLWYRYNRKSVSIGSFGRSGLIGLTHKCDNDGIFTQR